MTRPNQRKDGLVQNKILPPPRMNRSNIKLLLRTSSLGERRWHLAVPLLLFLIYPSGAFASFVGPVVSVLDGDTIEVLHNTHPERVRLSGIICPKNGQAFGNPAKQAASLLVFGRDVILQTHGQDKDRHTLADVFLSDGTHVNHALVKDGWCWWYRKYAPRDTVLEGLEKEARDAKKGLWVDPHPVPPWKWRERRSPIGSTVEGTR